jgi:hypothetical protein
MIGTALDGLRRSHVLDVRAVDRTSVTGRQQNDAFAGRRRAAASLKDVRYRWRDAADKEFGNPGAHSLISLEDRDDSGHVGRRGPEQPAQLAVEFFPTVGDQLGQLRSDGPACLDH